MTDEKTKLLYEKYPEIFVQKDLPMNQTCMCWGFSCSDGWFNIIDNLCGSIESWKSNKKSYFEYQLKKGEVTEEDRPFLDIQAVQVKEKFGGLRFYTNYTNEYIDGLVDMAEAMSFVTCEYCGNAGRPNKTGWISTLCDPCRVANDERTGYNSFDFDAYKDEEGEENG